MTNTLRGSMRMPESAFLTKIKSEIHADSYYSQFFSNGGQQFVAWYLRRVLLRNPVISLMSASI
jgi:hypothetical protein